MASKSSGIIRDVTPKERLIWYLVGAAATVYLAILVGASWTPGCSLSEWMDNFNRFILAEHHFIVGFTDMTPRAVMICLLVWTIGYLCYAMQIQHPYKDKEYGDAKWGNPAAFTKENGDHDKGHLVQVNFGADAGK